MAESGSSHDLFASVFTCDNPDDLTTFLIQNLFCECCCKCSKSCLFLLRVCLGIGFDAAELAILRFAVELPKDLGYVIYVLYVINVLYILYAIRIACTCKCWKDNFTINSKRIFKLICIVNAIVLITLPLIYNLRDDGTSIIANLILAYSCFSLILDTIDLVALCYPLCKSGAGDADDDLEEVETGGPIIKKKKKQKTIAEKELKDDAKVPKNKSKSVKEDTKELYKNEKETSEKKKKTKQKNGKKGDVSSVPMLSK